MKEDIIAITQNKTWNLVDLLVGEEAISLNGSTSQSSASMVLCKDSKLDWLQRGTHDFHVLTSQKLMPHLFGLIQLELSWLW